jgi:two-component system chemotaxis response regulator CheY
MFPPETRILIVEDMSSVREVIVEMCNALGFKNVTGSSDGANAWQTIQNAPEEFGIIISDLNMPKGSGMDLLIRLRAAERFKKTIFLMISAAFDEQNIVRAIKNGADHYLVKPFNAHDLGEKLKIVYQKRAGTVAT